MPRARPEHLLPPELYYNDSEAYKYTANSHIIDVQSTLTERALELLALPDDESCLLLDVGCGSGLSGEILSENGHSWVGIDISPSMLNVAIEREVDGDLILSDIGEYLPFRGAAFDGAISISAVQWLCNADKSSHNPVKRIRKFFESLYACLSRIARAVLQFYPETIDQLDLLQTEALRAGFSGGLVVDFPNSTRAKKYFLVLDVSPGRPSPQPCTVEDPSGSSCQVMRSRLSNVREARAARRCPKKSVAWIKKKKNVARYRMKDVAFDSKYTGRKRKPKF